MFLPFGSPAFFLTMAQADTSDPLTASATSTPCPSQSQPEALSTADAAPSPTEPSTFQQPFAALPSIETPVESDDDVQFIFSAPRRRKKKRRR